MNDICKAVGLAAWEPSGKDEDLGRQGSITVKRIGRPTAQWYCSGACLESRTRSKTSNKLNALNTRHEDGLLGCTVAKKTDLMKSAAINNVNCKRHSYPRDRSLSIQECPKPPT